METQIYFVENLKNLYMLLVHYDDIFKPFIIKYLGEHAASHLMHLLSKNVHLKSSLHKMMNHLNELICNFIFFYLKLND